MSCWVVPSVAAEYWGIPVADVLERVRRGLVETKREFGFTLVDVAPQSPKAPTGFRPPAARPLTYTSGHSEELTEAEIRALTADLPLADEEGQLEPTETGSGGDEEFDWRRARQAASQLRRPPRVKLAA